MAAEAALRRKGMAAAGSADRWLVPFAFTAMIRFFLPKQYDTPLANKFKDPKGRVGLATGLLLMGVPQAEALEAVVSYESTFGFYDKDSGQPPPEEWCGTEGDLATLFNITPRAQRGILAAGEKHGSFHFTRRVHGIALRPNLTERLESINLGPRRKPKKVLEWPKQRGGLGHRDPRKTGCKVRTEPEPEPEHPVELPQVDLPTAPGIPVEVLARIAKLRCPAGLGCPVGAALQDVIHQHQGAEVPEPPAEAVQETPEPLPEPACNNVTCSENKGDSEPDGNYTSGLGREDSAGPVPVQPAQIQEISRQVLGSPCFQGTAVRAAAELAPAPLESFERALRARVKRGDPTKHGYLPHLAQEVREAWLQAQARERVKAGGEVEDPLAGRQPPGNYRDERRRRAERAEELFRQHPPKRR